MLYLDIIVMLPKWLTRYVHVKRLATRASLMFCFVMEILLRYDIQARSAYQIGMVLDAQRRWQRNFGIQCRT